MSDPRQYDTNKWGQNGTGLITNYVRWFAPWKGTPAHILELGVAGSGSLQIWVDWFPGGDIVGLDIQVAPFTPGATVYQGNQNDTALLAAISAKHGPWDIIIDDCCHRADHARVSYSALWEHLKSGGLYCIEDWGTGYWLSGAYDGKLFEPHHQAGMVGMVKDLIDEIGTPWWTSTTPFGPKRLSQIREMVVNGAVVIIFKA